MAKAEMSAKINDNWVDKIQSLLQDILTPLFKNIFSSVQSTLHNGVAYSVIFIIVMFWLVNRLKQGYPTKDEIFEAIKWGLFTCFIFGIFYSYEAYETFLGWLMIPAQWVKAGIADSYGKGGESFGVLITKAMNTLNEFHTKLYDVGFKLNDSDYAPDGIVSIATHIGMFVFYIFYLCMLINIFGVASIVIVSQFFAMLVLTTAAIVIPLLINKKTMPYFFSWLKVFISYSLYAPLGFLILKLSTSTINELNKFKFDDTILTEIYKNQLSNFFVPILISIICIYLIKSIPNWISQIMGVQGLSGGGTGASAGFVVGAGASAGRFLGGYFSKRAAGGGVGRSIGSGLLNTIPMSRSSVELANQFKNNAANSKIANNLSDSKATDTKTGATAEAG